MDGTEAAVRLPDRSLEIGVIRDDHGRLVEIVQPIQEQVRRKVDVEPFSSVLRTRAVRLLPGPGFARGIATGWVRN